jgi:isoamylase
MATLLLSQGVPMICGGDEMGRTQGGNNNAYCQDNPISWHDWNLSNEKRAFLDFTKELIRLRQAHPIFRRKKYFSGRKIRGTDIKNITWHRPDGEEMTDAEWNESFVKVLGLRLSGEDIDEVDEQGELIRDETFLILMNAHYESISFVLPKEAAQVVWQLTLNTAADRLKEVLRLKSGDPFDLGGRSLALFKKIRS